MLRRKKNVPAENAPGASGTSEPAAATSPAAGQGRAPERLGELLVQERVITPEQLEEGLAKQKIFGGFLGQALVELGHLDQQTLTLLLVKQCRIPHLNLLDYQIDRKVLELVPEEVCREFRIIPVDKMAKILTVAMVDPLNVESLSAVREACPTLRIKPILCDWPDYEIVMEKLFDGYDSLELDVAQSRERAEGADADAGEPVDAAAEPDAEPAHGDPETAKVDADAVEAVVRKVLGENGSTAGLSSVERKLEMLAHSVAQIAQATDVFQAARKAEARQVSETMQRDLATGADVGAGEPAFGGFDPHSSTEEVGAERALDAGAPLGGYSFETFFSGEANRPALEMAKAVAGSPGRTHNPLFVCGDVGLGKTHLINAIGNAIVEASGLRVGYTSASSFAGHVTSAMTRGRLDAFRETHCCWDVLILDDIQFLGGHIEAQEEFFHLFNALEQQGRQIVIAGDKAPSKLGLLEKRLVSRFEAGIVVHLAAPEWDTRIRILQHQFEEADAAVPDEVLAMVAMSYANDVRRMTGCLHKIISFAGLNGGAVTCELASRVLAEAGAEQAA